MPRLSRPLRLPRWSIIPAAIVFLLMESFCIYLFVLNRRVTRELVHHTWREPTVVRSAKSGAEIAKLYGVDWRVTPPLAITDLPPHVPAAFLAAEDVRFHHHMGVDPIGMA